MSCFGFYKSTGLSMVVCLLLASSLFESSAFAQDDATERKYAPTSDYDQIEVEGWRVMVLRRLNQEDSEIGQKGLQLLGLQLKQITFLVPEPALSELKGITIWLDDDPRNQIHYHPEKKWLIDNDFNPDRAKAVDIGKIRHFVDVYRSQPFVVLHELAHAYHDQILGFDDSRVIEAYRKAKAGGKYESVLRIEGRVVEHYALTNHKEYFAEATEAFFGTNDFYPFVRSELAQQDETMHDLLKEIWLSPSAKQRED